MAERVEEVLLTKELVDYLLSINTENRSLHKERSQELANDIKNNGWRRIGSIAVSEKGVLADGQHRLMALRLAGIYGVPVSILWDATEETVRRIDRNRPRTAKDLTDRLGLKLTNNLIGAINTDLNFDHDKLFLKTRANTEPYKTLEHFYNKWEKIYSQMPALKSTLKNVPRTTRFASSYVCAIGNYGYFTSYNNANEFLDSVISGNSASNPAIRLREYILVTTGQHIGGISIQTRIRKAVYCINAHYRGGNIDRVREARMWEMNIGLNG